MTKSSSKIKLIRVTNLYDVTVKQFHDYVRNLHRHIRMQNTKIRRLRQKIVEIKKRHKKSQFELKQEEDDGDDFMKALERAEAQQVQESKADNAPLNIKAFVDDIKKTAQEFDYQNRYIYEPTSGLYYDPETGFYYNPIYGLHYDGQKGCYLKYNEQTQKYDFYSQVIPEESVEKEHHKPSQKKRKQQLRYELEDRERRSRLSRSRSHSRDRDREPRHRRPRRRSRSRSPYSVSTSSGTDEEDNKQRWKARERDRVEKQMARRNKKTVDSDDSKEEGELDSGDESDRNERVILIESSDSEKGSPNSMFDLDKYADKHSDISRKYPPSLRLVVQESNVASLKQGSLFIITCKGGSLGREGDHDVIIQDINISKYHLKFIYHGGKSTYQVLDLGSRNGTLLNGTRMAPTMQESDTFDLGHGDVIELNRTKLLCHIHDGNLTCVNCEPGLLMKSTGGGKPPEDDRITKPVSHKEGLKLLQRRYGLEDEKYVEPSASSAVDYNDRAAHRRKVKGSSNEHAKTQTASVDQQIGSENKGFKMLSKLGWSEGQTLGLNDQGLKEPIPMTTNVGTSGLGSRLLAEPTTGPDGAKKLIWQMTQERYKACADVEENTGAKVASLDKQIGNENKGYQMLAKLGWNKGQTLGKEGVDGLTEPVKLLSNVGTSGLGSKPLKKPGANTNASGKKNTIWKKKQSKCSATKLFDASDSE